MRKWIVGVAFLLGVALLPSAPGCQSTSQVGGLYLITAKAMLTFTDGNVTLSLTDFEDQNQGTETSLEIKVWASDATNTAASRRRVLKAKVEEDITQHTAIGYTASHPWSAGSRYYRVCLIAKYNGHERELYGDVEWPNPSSSATVIIRYDEPCKPSGM